MGEKSLIARERRGHDSGLALRPKAVSVGRYEVPYGPAETTDIIA